MIASQRKFIRSVFFQSIRIVSPCNHLRTARLDFWGAVGLVCVIGIAAKFVQMILAD
jgi:hypothetical protein